MKEVLEKIGISDPIKLNPVYLYILEHENEKINYSKIAVELSLTR